MQTGTDGNEEKVVPSGIDGLDVVLGGGYIGDRLYLIEGDPGSGKTTLALQFLRKGVELGERCMLVTLSETEDELRQSAASHGWSLDGIDIVEAVASEEALLQDARYTMYHPSEVELAEATRSILAEVSNRQPARLVLDSLSELRLLAENPLRYRRQILALKRHFSRMHCTVLFTDDLTGSRSDRHLHSLVHGIIVIERISRPYGAMRRRLSVAKQRSRPFREGYHDYRIRRGGIEVFPRIAATHLAEFPPGRTVTSGIEGLDKLLGGGLHQGTSTLLIGPAGTGKSAIATHFACAVAARGGRAAMFLFDESRRTLVSRAAAMGSDFDALVAAGRFEIPRIDPSDISPGEFANMVCRSVENGAEFVVIDSLNGYLNALAGEEHLALALHDVLLYLAQHDVCTLLLMTQHGFVGGRDVPIDASYLADAVLLLQHLEHEGEIRQWITMIKKRTGSHERMMREVRFCDRGLDIGAPVPVAVSGDHPAFARLSVQTGDPEDA